jgi:prefoldin subunit 5
MGIDETKRLVHVIKNDVIELMNIDYDKILEELKELDGEEKKELLIEVGSCIIQILAAIKLSSAGGKVFSAVVKAVT